MAALEWSDEATLASIIFSSSALQSELSGSSDATFYEVEAWTYERLFDGESFRDAQIAIRSDFEVFDIEKKKPLLRVASPYDGSTWWVEDGGWSEPVQSSGKPGYHRAPSYRTAGLLRLLIDGQTYHVRICPAGFGRTEYQELLRDFQAGCWELLIDEESSITEQTLIHSTFLDVAGVFAGEIESVIRKPQTALIEHFTSRSIARVRPDPGILQQLVRRPGAVNVLGRSHRSTWNTKENGYLLFLAERVREMIDVFRARLESGLNESRRFAGVQDTAIPASKRLLMRGGSRVQNRLEITALNAQRGVNRERARAFEEGLENANMVRRRLCHSINKLRNAGVRPVRYKPQSLLLTQRPTYSRVLRRYRELLKNAKSGESGLQSVLDLAHVGILDQPTVYERWCLLRVIDTLNTYGFRSKSEDWKIELVRRITSFTSPQRASCDLQFEQPDLKRRVRVRYQAQLPPRFRPDITLDFSTTGMDVSNKMGVTQENVFTLILDAKNKPFEFVPHDVADIHGKYSRPNNAVFALHPGYTQNETIPVIQNAVPRHRSSFGGDSPLVHRVGHVVLRPTVTIDLKVLLGLAMQFHMESHERRPLRLPLFCIRCGSVHLKQIEPEIRTRGTWWVCDNKSCLGLTIDHYCGECKTRLWKHGEIWTYHNTKDDCFNILCPHCGAGV